MNQRSGDVMDDFLHDVDSKCDSVKNAAALLPKTSPQKAAALLQLMIDQADSLVQMIAEFQRKRAS